MSTLRVLGLSLLLLCDLGIGRLLTDPSQLTTDTYDFVIVGGAYLLLPSKHCSNEPLLPTQPGPLGAFWLRA